MIYFLWEEDMANISYIALRCHPCLNNPMGTLIQWQDYQQSGKRLAALFDWCIWWLIFQTLAYCGPKKKKKEKKRLLYSTACFLGSAGPLYSHSRTWGLRSEAWMEVCSQLLFSSKRDHSGQALGPDSLPNLGLHGLTLLLKPCCVMLLGSGYLKA